MKGEPGKGELSSAQRTERLIVDIEKALADPKVIGGMREDLTRMMAEAREDMSKIRAEREGAPEGERKIRFVERKGSANKAYAGPLRLVAVKAERVSDEAVSEVLKRAGVKVGDAVTEESLKKLRTAAAGVDEHLRIVMSDDGQGGITVTIVS
jgi:hypothetical protein